ncbi:hypothetical protein Ddye_026381 [Dipteronia dyeriana]|uniref:Uncharacterized protein n=1 Tax=Dipteronia dyeriana TaxID=168575 RepID=A0AAD9TML7_9ROSI|nr:hypothetical protein Ddye_026381 [Dipteronia dyeriana]
MSRCDGVHRYSESFVDHSSEISNFLTVLVRVDFNRKLGVEPIIMELDHHVASTASRPSSSIRAVLGHQPISVVLVGGKFVCGIETLMACHINGTLDPLYKDADTLWL